MRVVKQVLEDQVDPLVPEASEEKPAREGQLDLLVQQDLQGREDQGVKRVFQVQLEQLVH